MSWPPPRPAPPAVQRRPWDPGVEADPDLAKDGDKLLYIVVDEVVEAGVGLSVSAWPDADSKGRVRFVRAATPSLELATTARNLMRFLSPDAYDEDADVVIGKTFAARLKHGTADDFFRSWLGRSEQDLMELSDLRTWLRDPCDISAQARYIAKLAYYGAVLSKLPEHVESRWNLGGEEDRRR